MNNIYKFTVLFAALLPCVLYADGTPIITDEESAQRPATIKTDMLASGQLTGQQGSAQLQVQPARAVRLYASDKAAEVMYERSGSVFNLNNSRASASFLFNETRDNAITGSIMYDVETSRIKDVTLSFGSKLYAGLLAVENTDVVGLAASIEAAYQFPIRRLPLKLSASVNYAPDILTFGQSDRIIDWNVRAGLALTSNIEGFVGLRFLQFDTRPGDRELDKKVHLGIRWDLAD